MTVEFLPNEAIPLEGEVRLRSASELGGEPESLRGRALLRLSPRPSLELRSSSEKNFALPNDAVLKSPSNDDEAFFATSTKTTSGENGPRAEVTWCPRRQPVLIRRLDEPVREIHFHVLNFPSFNGQGDEVRESARGGLSRHGRVKAQAGSWTVDLREVANLREIVDKLEESQGFAPTHRGCIVRSAGGTIDTEEACLFLDVLEDFLSFARGSRCSLGLVEARTKNGCVAWERWGCRRVDPWWTSSSWFDSQHGEILGKALPGFWRVCSASSDERAALQQAIYWYLRSDWRQSGVDGGLILMQAALERLAHTFYQAKNTKKQPVARWLESALVKWGVPVDLPPNFKALAAYMNSVTKGNDARRATLALTKLRNNTVHPVKTPVTSGAYYEAWELARWFIELSLLSVIGYQGSYANRVTRRSSGQVEAVPWARSPLCQRT